MGAIHLVQAIGGVCGRWSLEHRRGWLWRCGHSEMRPAVDICETRGDNIWVFYMSGVKREQFGCIRVLDVADVREPEGVDEITG
jgi:hypothetical protein